MIRIGIDNGANGAIVAIGDDHRIVASYLMPVIDVGVRRTRSNPKPHQTKTYKGTKRILDRQAVLRLLRDLIAQSRDDIFAVLEEARAGQKEGRGSIFTSGRGYGAMEMALDALGIPFQIEKPSIWQRAVLRGVEGTDTKARAIVYAQRMYPDLDMLPGKKRKPHDGLADACCMAHYALTIRPPRRRRRRPPVPVVS